MHKQAKIAISTLLIISGFLTGCIGEDKYNSGSVGTLTTTITPTTANIGDTITIKATLTNATKGTNQTPENIAINFQGALRNGNVFDENQKTCVIKTPTTNPATDEANSCSVTYKVMNYPSQSCALNIALMSKDQFEYDVKNKKEGTVFFDKYKTLFYWYHNNQVEQLSFKPDANQDSVKYLIDKLLNHSDPYSKSASINCDNLKQVFNNNILPKTATAYIIVTAETDYPGHHYDGWETKFLELDINTNF